MKTPSLIYLANTWILVIILNKEKTFPLGRVGGRVSRPVMVGVVHWPNIVQVPGPSSPQLPARVLVQASGILSHTLTVFYAAQHGQSRFIEVQYFTQFQENPPPPLSPPDTGFPVEYAIRNIAVTGVRCVRDFSNSGTVEVPSV